MANIDQETYRVLRHGGASRTRACAELCVSSGRGAMLEAWFQAPRPGGEMRPRFARHANHVGAVLAGGGYPAIRT